MRFFFARDRFVQAGAGTGKTHALVTQYLHLVAGLTAHLRPVEPRQLLAITFTDKAAGEMLVRLRQRVERLIGATRLGAEGVLQAEPDLVETARARGLALPPSEHWERVLLSLSGAQVTTFHSFCAGLLRRHADLAGVDPDFVLLDEDSAREMELEATERVVLAALESRAAAVERLVYELGFRGAPGQEALVEHIVSLRRRRAEEGRGIPGIAAPYEEEAVERAVARATREARSCLLRLRGMDALLGEKSQALAEEIWCRGSELDEASGLAGLPAQLDVLADIDERLGRLRARSKDEAARESLSAVRARFRDAREDLIACQHTVEAAPLAAALAGLCQAAWDAYDEAKRRQGALDFTDLLRRARDLLVENAPLRERTRARYVAILVDELQDINPLQGELISLVGGDPSARAASGEPGRLYLVGDRKQSIYEFRGADVAAYSRLCGALIQAGADEETLNVSRRSRRGVLDFINALFSQVMRKEEREEMEPPDFHVRWTERDALLPLAGA